LDVADQKITILSRAEMITCLPACLPACLLLLLLLLQLLLVAFVALDP
jgi:hypothetical protein